jgi:hypothetical protein
MKKYLSGLIAVICAFTFSAFTKPYTTYTFKLLDDLGTLGIVRNPEEWSTAGTYFGLCTTTGTDLACEIKLNTTQSSYFHTDGTDKVLNTYDYANTATPKQDHLVITEGMGLTPDRIITPITPKHWDPTAGGGAGAYVTASLGADLVYKNGNY